VALPFGQLLLPHLLDLLSDVAGFILDRGGRCVSGAESDGGGRARLVVLELLHEAESEWPNIYDGCSSSSGATFDAEIGCGVA
jgi:hypothetical protein